MTEPDKPIEGIPGKSPVSEPEPTPTGPAPMEEEAPSKPFDIGAGKGAAPGVEGPSPMEVAQQAGQAEAVTAQSLQQHSDQLRVKAQNLTQALDETTYNKLSDGQKALLMKKAHQYAEQMGHVANMGGAKYSPGELKPGARPELGKILNWFNGATETLQNAGGIDAIAAKGKLSVPDMLRVQARLNAADRVINFASAVVGKFSDALKQLGQTQI